MIDATADALGVPQRLLAALIGVSEHDLSNYRRGHRSIPAATLWSLMTFIQANGLGHLLTQTQSPTTAKGTA
jgi:hypothetical protein